MKITGYRLVGTTHDWGRRIGDVNGVNDDTRTAQTVLVVETDEGIDGIALNGCAEVAHVWPAVEGRDPRSVAGLFDAMLAQAFKAGHVGRTYQGVAAIDTALWDIKAKAAGEPLWRLLGGADRVVPAYASGLDFGLDDDQLHAFYADFAARGFTGAKLKGGADLADDLRRFAVITGALGVAHPLLALDVNERWNPKQALRYLAALEAELDLAWIEEPVRRWDVTGLATVSRGTRCAVATGENLSGVEQYLPLITAGAVDLVQASGVWGITHFLRVAHLAAGHDLPVSAVGFVGNPLAAAATAVPNHTVLEIQGTALPAGISADQTFDDGMIILGDQPGLGYTLDETAVVPYAPSGPWGPHVRPPGSGLGFSLHG